jgi:hypothetical protein|tara:strand:- start:1058 stop:1501 length:444 start_codon:yes stop_codon:yes gene_type:complete
MSHIRQQIREQVGTTLTGLTTTGSNVFESRVYPLSDASLPALIIYSKSETSSISTMGTGLGIDRTMTLTIEAYVKANLTFDDTIDTICAEVEVAMGTDPSLNGKVRFSYLESTDIDYDGDGENPIGYATMNYVVEYRTAQNAPSTGI